MAELGKETWLGLSASSEVESGNPSSGSKRQNPSGLEAGSKRQKGEEQQQEDVYDYSKFNPSSGSNSQKDKAVNPSSLDTQVVEEDDDDVFRFDENGYFITPSPFRKKGLDHSKYKNYKGVNCCALSCLRPFEGEKLDFHSIFGPRENVKRAPLTTSMVDQMLLKRDLDAKCLCGDYLSPYCSCSKDPNACSPILTRRAIEAYPALPVRALEKHREHFIPIWLAYYCQTSQSHCFDIDDHPGSSLGASVVPLLPYKDFSGNLELLMELSNRAVQEYNEKDCHLYKYKYKVLKIEKVNFTATAGGYYDYWMTVKVVNLTLATPIETFQIHVGRCVLTEEKVIYCCRPKEEMIDGVSLPNCDVCFRKVRDVERLYCGLS